MCLRICRLFDQKRLKLCLIINLITRRPTFHHQVASLAMCSKCVAEWSRNRTRDPDPDSNMGNRRFPHVPEAIAYGCSALRLPHSADLGEDEWVWTNVDYDQNIFFQTLFSNRSATLLDYRRS